MRNAGDEGALLRVRNAGDEGGALLHVRDAGDEGASFCSLRRRGGMIIVYSEVQHAAITQSPLLNGISCSPVSYVIIRCVEKHTFKMDVNNM